MVTVMARNAGTDRGAPGDPRDDVISALAALDLDDDDVDTLALELVIAGNDTTANLIGTWSASCSTTARRWERVRADRSLVPVAVEETLRRRGSSKGLFRRVTRDVELAGEAIAAGAIVHVLFAAANHDEARFERRASSTSTGPRPTIWPSAAGRISASARRSRGWRHGSRSTSSCDRHPGLHAVPGQRLDYAPTLTTQTLEKFLVELR